MIPNLWENVIFMHLHRVGGTLGAQETVNSIFELNTMITHILRHMTIKYMINPLDVVYVSNGEKNDINYNRLKKLCPEQKELME